MRTLNPVGHEFASALRFVGLRDRLRCPACKAVGTWKPHGAILDLWDEWRLSRDPQFPGNVRWQTRRWLCKWCGYYVGPEGTRRCVVDTDKKAWALPEECPGGTTPAAVVIASRISRTWPWRG